MKLQNIEKLKELAKSLGEDSPMKQEARAAREASKSHDQMEPEEPKDHFEIHLEAERTDRDLKQTENEYKAVREAYIKATDEMNAAQQKLEEKRLAFVRARDRKDAYMQAQERFKENLDAWKAENAPIKGRLYEANMAIEKAIQEIYKTFQSEAINALASVTEKEMFERGLLARNKIEDYVLHFACDLEIERPNDKPAKWLAHDSRHKIGDDNDYRRIDTLPRHAFESLKRLEAAIRARLETDEAEVAYKFEGFVEERNQDEDLQYITAEYKVTIFKVDFDVAYLLHP